MSSLSASLGGWPGPRRGSSSSSMVTYSAMTRSSRQACTGPPRRSTLLRQRQLSAASSPLSPWSPSTQYDISDLGRSPTAVELADHLHVTVDEVLKELGVAMSRREISLDQPLGEDDDCLGDRLATPGPGEEPEDLLALAGLIAELPGLERTVVVLRFFEDLDQSTIAARIGYSQMQVSRLERRALARMRTQLLEP